MQTIIMLAMANMKKGKGNLVTLIGLVFLAALFLNLGLLLLLNLGRFYTDRVAALNGAHAMVIMTKDAYEQKDLQYFEEYPGVTETEAEDILFLMNVDFKFGGNIATRFIVVNNFDTPWAMSKVSFIGEHLAAGEDSVYLPYMLSAGGYALGDAFTMTYDDKDYTFTVAGFLEDVTFASMTFGAMNIFMPDYAYERFSSVLNDKDLSAVKISVRLKNPDHGGQLIQDYLNSLNSFDSEDRNDFIHLYTDSVELQYFRFMISDMISMILVAFSVIVVVVCLIVVRFRIITNIQDGMTNIGALKALGYTSGQIIGSIVLQFACITSIASLCGVFASYLAASAVSGIFIGQIGLNWQQGFDISVSSVTFILILATVIVVGIFSAGRINGLHPIVALRGGIKTHNFMKNRFPLAITNLNLQAALAFKSMTQNMKQNLMISIILMSASFTVLFSFIMFYNFAVDNTEFIKIGIREPCAVSVYTDEYSSSLIESIKRMPEVRKAIYTQTEYSATILGNERIAIYVTEDFYQSESSMLIEGRYPIHDNEIAFPGVLAKKYEKNIGETVTVKIGRNMEEYLITGIFQSLNEGGKVAGMTYEGIKKLQKSFTLSEIDIFLNEHEDPASFIDILKDECGGRITSTINIDEAIKSSMSIYVTIAVSISAMVLATTVIVIVLVLYLIIKTYISQRRHDIGIQKALGYTTLQLMHQIALSFIPVVLVGAVSGGFLGLYYINSILSYLFSTMGIMQMNFTINFIWVIADIIIITIFSYMISMVIAWRIRKITPYELTGE